MLKSSNCWSVLTFLLTAIVMLVLLAPQSQAVDLRIRQNALRLQWDDVYTRIAGDSASVYDPVARLLSAHAAVQTNRNREARVLFESVTDYEDLQSWEAYTDSLAEHLPRHPVALCLSADAKLRLQRFDVAAKLMDSLWALKNDFALGWLTRGEIRLAVKNFADAETDFATALRIDTTLTEALFKYGIALEKQSNFDSAIAIYGQVIKRDPNFIRAYVYRAGVFRERGDYDWAISDLNEALKRDPRYCLSHFILALTYDEAGRSEEAISTYKTFLEHVNNRWKRLERVAQKRIAELQK